MARLILRNVPQEIVDALEARAKRHGRSPEDEHRVLLGEHLFRLKPRSVKEVLAELAELDRKEAIESQHTHPPTDDHAE